MLCLTLALALLASTWATRFYLSEGQSRAEAALGLTIQALDGHLGRYEAIPDLLADHETMRRFLDNPNDEGLRQPMNAWLHAKNQSLESSDIYVMTADGVTIAASNHDRADSFVGQNFSYRPYFSAAIAGKKGRFYAIGTTSGVRGYYFAAPVKNQSDQVTGVVAVKIGLDVIEAEWRAQDAQILVTDPEGIVFLSTDPAWLYKGLLTLTPERLARTTASRRYADVPLSELSYTDTDGLMEMRGSNGVLQEFLVAETLMPKAGWTAHVLLDTASLRGQARLAVAATLLLFAAGFAMLIMFRQRRGRLAERIALQEEAKAELERRVEARTADIARVNRLIEAEVAERRLTEAELRRTQSDLIQAGKLAALGQMSAALSHEINQPLAAARNYADSAAILLDRGQPARAKENIGQILALIDRMAAIARHLRNVARKPDAPLRDIVLTEAIAEALALANPRLHAAKAEVTIALPANLPAVRGGPVRLQQVLVNILSNAADAMEGGTDKRIEIAADRVGKRVHLRVRDHGLGVSAAITDRIFDPFFTTKGVGAGLGLGLSISYNIMKDFGGDLRVANDPDGGAVFTLDLVAVVPMAEAAE